MNACCKRRIAWKSASGHCGCGTDAALYLSEDAAEWVRAMAPGVAAHALVPYCFESFGEERPAPAGHEIMFGAGFAHPPNEDAACWFVANVLPLVRARVADATLSIVVRTRPRGCGRWPVRRCA